MSQTGSTPFMVLIVGGGALNQAAMR